MQLPLFQLRSIGIRRLAVVDGGPWDLTAPAGGKLAAADVVDRRLAKLRDGENQFAFVGRLALAGADAEQWSSYVSAAAGRFAGEVTDWIIDPPADADARELADLVTRASGALKSAAPGARLVVPCGSIADDAARARFESVLDLVSEAADVIGFTDASPPGACAENLAWLRDLLRARTIEKPIWHLDLTSPARSALHWWIYRNSDYEDPRPDAATAAADVVKKFVAGKAAGVEAVTADFTSEQPFTLTDYGLTPTPQALALSAVSGRLAGARFARRETLDVPAEVHLFAGAEGAIAVLWRADGGADARGLWLALEPQTLRVLSHYGGRRVELPPRPSYNAAPVDEDPVIVLAPGMDVDELARSLKEARVETEPPTWLR